QEAAHQRLDFVPAASVQVQLRHGLCVEQVVRRVELRRPTPASPGHRGVAGVGLALWGRMKAPFRHQRSHVTCHTSHVTRSRSTPASSLAAGITPPPSAPPPSSPPAPTPQPPPRTAAPPARATRDRPP